MSEVTKREEYLSDDQCIIHLPSVRMAFLPNDPVVTMTGLQSKNVKTRFPLRILFDFREICIFYDDEKDRMAMYNALQVYLNHGRI